MRAAVVPGKVHIKTRRLTPSYLFSNTRRTSDGTALMVGIGPAHDLIAGVTKLISTRYPAGLWDAGDLLAGKAAAPLLAAWDFPRKAAIPDEGQSRVHLNLW
jgi:hypothetical protein